MPLSSDFISRRRKHLLCVRPIRSMFSADSLFHPFGQIQTLLLMGSFLGSTPTPTSSVSSFFRPLTWARSFVLIFPGS